MQPWIIDETHTNIGFSVRHMMVSTVRGRFKQYRGTVEIDPVDFTRSVFKGEIDVASIDTDNPQRDEHLRSNDFFDAANHPTISFVSTRIEPKRGGEYVLHGDLTIRGVTRSVALDVEFHGTAKSPWGKTVAGLSVRGAVNRKDFGVSFNAVLDSGGVMVGETVKLELELEAVAGEDASAA